MCETEKAVCLRVKTNKAGSEPERDYDDHDEALWCKLYARDFLPMHGEISPIKHSETWTRASVFWCDRGEFTRKTTRLHLAREITRTVPPGKSNVDVYWCSCCN